MSDAQGSPRFWTKKRIGTVLILVGVLPTFLYGLYNTYAVYLDRPPDVSGQEAARESLIRTWNVGKVLWPYLPIGLVVYLLGVMETAEVKRRE